MDDEIHSVQTNFGGLLNDWPRKLFTLVPLMGCWTNDIYSKGVDPVLDLELIVVEG